MEDQRRYITSNHPKNGRPHEKGHMDHTDFHIWSLMVNYCKEEELHNPEQTAVKLLTMACIGSNGWPGTEGQLTMMRVVAARCIMGLAEELNEECKKRKAIAKGIREALSPFRWSDKF